MCDLLDNSLAGFCETENRTPSDTAFLLLNLFPRKILLKIPKRPCIHGLSTVLELLGIRDHENVYQNGNRRNFPGQGTKISQVIGQLNVWQLEKVCALQQDPAQPNK